MASAKLAASAAQSQPTHTGGVVTPAPIKQEGKKDNGEDVRNATVVHGAVCKVPQSVVPADVCDLCTISVG